MEALGAEMSRLEISWSSILSTGLPTFGALDWVLHAAALGHAAEEACPVEASRAFRDLLIYHLQDGTVVPSVHSLDYLSTVASQECPVGKAAALLGLALSHASVLAQGPPAGSREEEADGDEELLQEVGELVGLAEAHLRTASPEEMGRLTIMLDAAGKEWPIWALLHQLSRAHRRSQVATAPPDSCLIIIYASPTDEIRRDTAQALQALEQHYFKPLATRHPIIVFTDEATAGRLEEELGSYTSASLVPAVIPMAELERAMPSYSCIDGIDCQAGAAPQSQAHRGVVNKTQFWSSDYLRISRYTAGPLFRHRALDRCGAFLKIDTDFYLTGPLQRDPLREIRLEGARLAYWQIHVQGQRQEGFMNAAVSFLRERGLGIRNKAFYARGGFEEKAERLGIPLSEVPEALEAATVVYGCLFGGDVRFFREPMYQDFFRYMDQQRGFETAGWSNQFFLGMAAAAFVSPSQIRRLYISGRHQESNIGIANGNVTEYLTGASKVIFR